VLHILTMSGPESAIPPVSCRTLMWDQLCAADLQLYIQPQVFK
jgi:hypothetical protein